MKLFFRIIGYLFMFIYFIIVITISVFVLKENEYGITKFNHNYMVVINNNNQNDNYKNGDLVVVRETKIDDIKENDEVFFYISSKNNVVDIKICNVREVSLETDPKFINVTEGKEYYRSDSILGKKVNKYEHIGGIINFLKDRIIFLILLIVPSVIMLVYELYNLINKTIELKKENEEEIDIENNEE